MKHEGVSQRGPADEHDRAEALGAPTGRTATPLLAPLDSVLQRLDTLVAQISEWSAAAGSGIMVRWDSLLVDRARSTGLRKNGPSTVNGTCRLLPARDAWVACNLARPDDVALVDALTGGPAPAADPWSAVSRAAARAAADEVVARGRLLGLPVARLDTPWVIEQDCGLAMCGIPDDPRTSPPYRATRSGGWPWAETQLWEPCGRSLSQITVVDLSSMWAGPLAARLLMEAGATVTKVESTARPDGARGTPGFYRLLHPDHQPSVVLDLGNEEGRRQLRSVIESADVVVEASRPRALEQLGCGPFQVSPRAGRVWLSITGYGRSAPGRDWVAFGDDAAVAGGLVGWERTGLPVFLADAIADPVTGITAALAVFRSLASGGGALLDVPMALCAAFVAGHGAVP